MREEEKEKILFKKRTKKKKDTQTRQLRLQYTEEEEEQEQQDKTEERDKDTIQIKKISDTKQIKDGEEKDNKLKEDNPLSITISDQLEQFKAKERMEKSIREQKRRVKAIASSIYSTEELQELNNHSQKQKQMKALKGNEKDNYGKPLKSEHQKRDESDLDVNSQQKTKNLYNTSYEANDTVANFYERSSDKIAHEDIMKQYIEEQIQKKKNEESKKQRLYNNGDKNTSKDADSEEEEDDEEEEDEEKLKATSVPPPKEDRLWAMTKSHLLQKYGIVVGQQNDDDDDDDDDNNDNEISSTNKKPGKKKIQDEGNDSLNVGYYGTGLMEVELSSAEKEKTRLKTEKAVEALLQKEQQEKRGEHGLYSGSSGGSGNRNENKYKGNRYNDMGFQPRFKIPSTISSMEGGKDSRDNKRSSGTGGGINKRKYPQSNDTIAYENYKRQFRKR